MLDLATKHQDDADPDALRWQWKYRAAYPIRLVAPRPRQVAKSLERREGGRDERR
jgi:hypothetical protein